MKTMKNFLLVVIAAMTLFACSKEKGGVTQSEAKTMKFAIGISKLSTKAADISAGALNESDVLSNIKDLKIEFLNAAGTTIEEYNLSGSDPILEKLRNGESILFHDVNSKLATVRVKMNVIGNGESVNNLQVYNSDTFLKVMEYVGQEPVKKSNVTPPTVDPDDENAIWEANVTVVPAMSRFEVSGTTMSVKYPTSTALPANVTDASNVATIKALTELAFTDEEINIAKANAEAKWLAANGGVAPVEGYTYTYSVTYSRKYDEITSVDSVYMNNFLTSKNATDPLLHANNGAGEWNKQAVANYKNYSSSADFTFNCNKMWDQYTLLGKTCIAYNLLPQTAATNDIDDVKRDLPHVIFKVTYTLNSSGSVANRQIMTRSAAANPIPQWVTIRAFKTTESGTPTVTAFEPGKAYQLDLANVLLNNLQATLTVKATAEGKTEESDPEVKDEDPIDPNPEPKKTDLRVSLIIQAWEGVGVSPIW